MPLALIAVGHHVYLGLGLLALMPVFGSLGGAADTAMVADLVAPERQEAAYASVRVAANLGVTIGPPIGGLLLIGGHWTTSGSARSCCRRSGSRSRGATSPAAARTRRKARPQRGSFGVIIRDSPFLLFMLASVFATMTYVATETLLPISVTTTHHLSPALWGFLMILNPLFVTVFQLRLTRRVAHIPASVKLGLAMPMMGVPFLLLNVNGSAPVIALVIVHLRHRRDALGADVAGGRRRARAGGHPRRVHGRVRRHVVGRLGGDAVPRPAGAPHLRRRDDVDVRRLRRGDRRASSASPPPAATTPSAAVASPA